MRYDFGSTHLKVPPGENTFGDAWEAFCFALLRAESSDRELVRVKAPDHGVDILDRSGGVAWQCKATAQGRSGSIPVTESRKSLERALAGPLKWTRYVFATNAPFSASALAGLEAAMEPDGRPLSFHGPEHWAALCDAHLEAVRDQLDYRFLVTEAEVVETYRRLAQLEARAAQAEALLRTSQLRVELENNQTPHVLQLPLAPDVEVRELVDLAAGLLGVAAGRDDGGELETTVSLTVSKRPRAGHERVAAIDLGAHERLRLEIRVKSTADDDPFGGPGRLDRPVKRSSFTGIVWVDSAQARTEKVHDIRSGIWARLSG